MPKQVFVIVGDIHENTEKLAHIPELKKADGLIITGDLTNAGSIREARPVLEAAKKYTKHIFAQIGNMDYAEVTDFLEEEGVNMHRKVRPLSSAFPDVALMGLGGSSTTPFNTPSEFTEEQIASFLEEMAGEAKNYRRCILVSHTPPKDTKCDALPAGIHVGSQAVRDFISHFQPQVCLCGHIHEGIGTDTVGTTQIINTGTLEGGGYGLLHITKEEIRAEFFSWS